MNVCHQTPLSDDEVAVLFRWLDPKGLGAVSREDLQARLDGFLPMKASLAPSRSHAFPGESGRRTGGLRTKGREGLTA